MNATLRFWFSLASVAAAGLAFAGCSLSPSESAGVRLARARYERIRVGMSLSEVRVAVGEKPTDSVSYPELLGPGWKDEPYVEPNVRMRGTSAEGGVLIVCEETSNRSVAATGLQSWMSDDAVLLVHFRQDRVLAKAVWRRLPEWEVTARDWIYWLPDLVGL